MKKLLITGGVMLIVGAMLFGIGFAVSGGNVSALNVQTKLFSIAIGEDANWTRNEYTFSADGVTDLQLDVSCDDVEFGISEDGEIHVYCYETDSRRYSVTTKGKTLKIKQDEGIQLFSIHIAEETHTVTVLTPKGTVFDVDVSSASGDMRVTDMSFGAMSFDTASGNAEINNITVSSLSFKSASGDMELQHTSIENAGDTAIFDTSSGNLTLEEVRMEGSADVEAVSGDVTLNGVRAEERLKCETVSGEIQISSLDSESVSLSTTSGDIDFSTLAATKNVRLESVSGNIAGTLMGRITDYSITSETTSGRNNLPGQHSGGDRELNVETVSGNIEVKFSED